MMKIVKLLTAVVVALVLLVAAALAYVAATFDAARIKQEVAQAVLAKTGRTLSIDGDLALRFWPSLGVDAAKVSLSEHNSKEHFAGLDSAHVAVSVLPLLSKRIVVDRIEVKGLSAMLVKDSNGHLNIDDLLGNKKDDGSASPPPEFDVAGISINNARLTWRDERAGRKLTIADLDFSTGHAVGSKDGISVEALKLATKGKLAADTFDLALDVPAIARKGEQIKAARVTLKAAIKGAARTASVGLELSDIDGTLQALKIGGLAVDVDATMGDKTVKGKLKTPLVLDMETSTVTVPALAGGFDVDMPGLPVRPLRLPITGHIKANYGKPAVSGSVSTAFDESHIDARFNILATSPPNIGIELDIDKLNVDKYLPPAPAAATKSAPGDERIDLSALKSINASGSVRIGELQVKNIKARRLNVTFKAANGNVSIAPHSAELYGGQVKGALSVAASGNRIALNESLTGIDINPLLRDAAGKDIVEGKGDVALDVATQGETVTALKKTLSGTARAVLRDGAIKGINIAQSMRNAKAKLSGSSAQQANAADKTDFSELGASFKIANGVAHNDDLAAKSPFLRLNGNGDIDIGNSQINYVLKASVVSTAAGQGGKEVDSLKGLTLPVRVSGPLENPSFKLELASMVSDSAKANLEEKKQQVQDKMKDKLKGMFKK